MNVYVMMGGFDYEGEQLIGVFSSPEKARLAIIFNETEYDDVTLYQCDVDGKNMEPVDFIDFLQIRFDRLRAKNQKIIDG